jgi:hypothetical protein
MRKEDRVRQSGRRDTTDGGGGCEEDDRFKGAVRERGRERAWSEVAGRWNGESREGGRGGGGGGVSQCQSRRSIWSNPQPGFRVDRSMMVKRLPNEGGQASAQIFFASLPCVLTPSRRQRQRPATARPLPLRS